MSIEQALADNTAAIKALTKAWESLSAQARAVSTQVDKGEANKVNVVGVAEIPLAKVEEKKACAYPCCGRDSSCEARDCYGTPF